TDSASAFAFGLLSMTGAMAVSGKSIDPRSISSGSAAGGATSASDISTSAGGGGAGLAAAGLGGAAGGLRLTSPNDVGSMLSDSTPLVSAPPPRFAGSIS